MTAQTVTKEATVTVQGKLVEILDQLQHGVIDLGGKAVKYAPDIANALLGVVKLQGIQELLTALSFFVPMVICLTLGSKLWNWARAQEWSSYDDGEFIPYIGVGILYIASSMFGYGVSSRLLDVWTWTAVFEPKLWIAHRLVEKVL